MDQVERPLSSRMKEWTLATSLVWLKVKSATEVDRLSPYGRIDVGRIESWYNDHVSAWRNRLRPELFAGTFTATASRWKNGEKQGPREVVDSFVWRDAELVYDISDRYTEISVRIPAARRERGEGSFELREISFSRADVQSCFASIIQQSRSFDDLAASHAVSLADAKEWIICRGETIPYEVYEEREVDVKAGGAEVVGAEREMFNKIDAATKQKRLDVYGIKENDRRRQQVLLPIGIWDNMNKTPGHPPSFTEITFDDYPAPGEDRAVLYGTVHLADETYNFVNVPSSFVLETWPPNVDSVGATIEPTPTAPAFSEYVMAGANEYERAERFLAEFVSTAENPTLEKFVALVEDIASSTVARATYRDKRPPHLKSGPRGPRKKRDK